jgi:hypothetical protein
MVFITVVASVEINVIVASNNVCLQIIIVNRTSLSVPISIYIDRYISIALTHTN